MNFEAVKNKIEEWLQPTLNEKNLFLVDIKFPMGRQVEVYVDSDKGIHISECAEISRFLEKNLDGSGLVPDNYILEVSSPGMDNPLRVPRQYKRRIGRVLEITKTDGAQVVGELVEGELVYRSATCCLMALGYAQSKLSHNLHIPYKGFTGTLLNNTIHICV